MNTVLKVLAIIILLPWALFSLGLVTIMAIAANELRFLEFVISFLQGMF